MTELLNIKQLADWLQMTEFQIRAMLRKKGQARMRHSREKLDEIRATVTPYFWNAQYQAVPSLGDLAFFDTSRWPRYDHPTGVEFSVIGIDAGNTQTKSGSYSALVCLGCCGDHLKVLGARRGRWRQDVLIDELWEFYRAMARLTGKQPMKVIVERAAAGYGLIDHLSGKLPIEPLIPKGSKEARAESVCYLPNKGVVKLPTSGAWVRDFTEELDNFPLCADKDQVDAFVHCLWDAESGRELQTMRGPSGIVSGVAFSPDGNHLAFAGLNGTARVWDTVNGREVFNPNRSVSAVAFSPDGKRLATTGGQSTVWDAESGRELQTLRGPSFALWGVVFSPDGTRLATANNDNTVTVWDAESGTELFTLRTHSRQVLGVAFSPDGKRLATESPDETVQIYALDVRELLNLARSRVTRTLTAEECQRYFQSATCPPLP